jgi:hypothetical protein
MSAFASTFNISVAAHKEKILCSRFASVFFADKNICGQRLEAVNPGAEKNETTDILKLPKHLGIKNCRIITV